MNAEKAKPALSVAIEEGKTDMQTINHSRMTFTFSNDATLELDTSKLNAEIISAALAHGLKQKLVDAAAISRDPANGRAASIDVKYAAVKEVLDRLLEGEWNKRREGRGTGGLLFRALCEMYEGRKTPEQIKEYLEAKSDKEKAALRKNPKVAEVIDRLRAEEGDGSGDDLLAELEEGEEHAELSGDDGKSERRAASRRKGE